MTNIEQFELCLKSDTYKKWVKGCNILQVVYSPLQQAVFCLIKEDENTFSMIRFFSLTEDKVAWNASLELQNTTHEEAITYLMDQMSDNIPQLSIEPQKFFDKYDEQITVGCNVLCDKTEDNEEFQGHVEKIQATSSGMEVYVVVIDQDGDAFCIDPDKLEVI